jgi:hypothetical protein
MRWSYISANGVAPASFRRTPLISAKVAEGAETPTREFLLGNRLGGMANGVATRPWRLSTKIGSRGECHSRVSPTLGESLSASGPKAAPPPA